MEKKFYSEFLRNAARAILACSIDYQLLVENITVVYHRFLDFRDAPLLGSLGVGSDAMGRVRIIILDAVPFN